MNAPVIGALVIVLDSSLPAEPTLQTLARLLQGLPGLLSVGASSIIAYPGLGQKASLTLEFEGVDGETVQPRPDQRVLEIPASSDPSTQSRIKFN